MKNVLKLFTLLIATSLMFTACKTEEEKKTEKAGKVIAEVKKKLEKVSAQSQYLKAMKDLRTISVGMSSYLLDNTKFPAWKNIKAMASDKDMKFHIKNIPVKDPWGNDYLIKCDGEKFWLATSGPDGKFDGFNQIGTFSSYEEGKDVVNREGTFVFLPAAAK